MRAHLHPHRSPAGRVARRITALGATLGAGLLAAVLLSGPARAEDGHDHGHDHGGGAPAVNGNGPHRLPDGSVFLPKPSQHQLGLRTVVVAESQLARAFELSGKVVMDPNAGGRVQAALAGRLEPGPRGLPGLGQRVRQGEVLAWVTPSAGALEKSTQQAQLAELRAARALADKRLARLRELADTVARKEIEAAEAELAGLAERAQALQAGLQQRDTLVAPVGGVIASAQAVAGQVVEPGALLFEIVDPARLRIEALAYDTRQAVDVAGAELLLPAAAGGATPGGGTPGGASGAAPRRLPLAYLGSARALREQALPLVFRAQGAALAEVAQLALGQTVQLVVRTRSRVTGLAVPAAALMKNPANQTIVWVKTAPERFEPRVVRSEPLDGAHIAVVAGLQPGDRVVSAGASLLNQIR
ncbi:MAG: hypothetical protein RLZZ584_1064 [Pseudomonadota bacterium]